MTAALFAAILVYVAHHPSDSVAVEQGDALWYTALTLALALLGTWIPTAPVPESADVNGANGESAAADAQDGAGAVWLSRLVDAGPWLLAGWMVIAAAATCPPGNLRAATNEAWLWIALAALFTASRRLVAVPTVRRLAPGLLVAVATLLAVHALHQQFVSLPRNQAEYRADPERVLRLAGVEAPAGSAERMVFESRLFDGGPSATFALANSLAGVLLVGVVLAAALLRAGWPRFGKPARVGWLVAAGLIAGGLVVTGSRSGVLAAVVGIALAFLLDSRWARGRAGTWVRAIAWVGLVSVVVGLAIVAFGDPEWLAGAPASLAFRFQYWRSTWALAVDRPWFGAGPGSFQAIYGQYREATASEQIAEPHNFFFETLAAGGFFAAVLLVGWFAAIVAWRRFGRTEERAAADEGQRRSAADGLVGRWLVGGAVASWILVWLVGGLTGWLPDVEAHLWAVPAAALVGAGVLGSLRSMRPGDEPLSGASYRAAERGALVALLLHLTVSSGWTIPGVATLVMWLAASVAGPPADATGRRGVGRAISFSGGLSRWSAGRLAWSGLLLVVLLSWYVFAWRPTQQKRLAVARAERAQAAGRLEASVASLREAVEADPWSADAALWLADALHWQLVTSADLPRLRTAWQEAVEEARSRAGEDPAMLRMLGVQQVHLFQRFGRVVDLVAARDTFLEAFHWNPSHQWLAAQVAAIADALGDEKAAAEFADRAAYLADLGDNLERDLERQLIYRPQPLGRAVAGGPARAPASELLANRAEPPGVSTETGVSTDPSLGDRAR